MSLKLIALVPAVLITVAVSAQFKKGTRMVGATIGNIFVNSGNSDVSYPNATQGYTSNSTSFGLSLNPSIGWFINERTVIGATLAVNPTKNKTTFENGGNTFQKDESTAFNIGIGAFARNYFSTSSSFMPFGQAGFNVGISTQKTNGFFIAASNAYKSTYDGKSSGGSFANAALSIGMTKLLNPHIGLDIYAGYNFSYTKNKYKTTTLRDDLNNGSIDLTSISEPESEFTNHGFMVGVGLQIFLH
jgi:outer membrane protein W